MRSWAADLIRGAVTNASGTSALSQTSEAGKSIREISQEEGVFDWRNQDRRLLLSCETNLMVPSPQLLNLLAQQQSHSGSNDGSIPDALDQLFSSPEDPDHDTALIPSAQDEPSSEGASSIDALSLANFGLGDNSANLLAAIFQNRRLLNLRTLDLTKVCENKEESTRAPSNGGGVILMQNSPYHYCLPRAGHRTVCHQRVSL